MPFAFLISHSCFSAAQIAKISYLARRVARGGNGGNRTPIPKVALKMFRMIKLLMCKPKKCVSANQRNCLKNLFYFNF